MRSSDFVLRSDYLIRNYSPCKESSHLSESNPAIGKSTSGSISRISPEWEIREETAPISTVEISVPVTETPVLATETAPKGKGKGNKTNTVTKIQARNEHSTSNDNGEAGRRAELLQMAANATSASRHA